jgi:hypothetical protein
MILCVNMTRSGWVNFLSIRWVNLNARQGPTIFLNYGNRWIQRANQQQLHCFGLRSAGLLPPEYFCAVTPIRAFPPTMWHDVYRETSLLEQILESYKQFQGWI